MTTLKISLSDEMRAFVEEQMTRTGHTSASDYLHALIREAQRRNAKLELEEKLADGLRGSPVEMTGADWRDIEREATKDLGIARS
jgi:antitoxin ParD1/3/4